MIVAEDADLASAVPAIMGSAFGAAGQRCLAGSVCVIAGDESPPGRGAGGPARRGRGAEHRPRCRPRHRRLPDGRPRGPRAGGGRRRDRARRRASSVLLDGRLGGGEAGTLLGPTLVEVVRPRVGAGPRGDLRPGARAGRRPGPRRRDRVRQRLALRQRRLDLHHLRRRRPRLPLGHRGGDARRQHRRARRRWPGSPSRAGRTRSTATCTPTAATPSTSTRARRSSPAAGSGHQAAASSEGPARATYGRRPAL